MRSGSTAWRAPVRRGTPSTTMRDVPAPVILAPILLRQSATSPTSGSRAALSMTVVPFARGAAPSFSNAAASIGAKVGDAGNLVADGAVTPDGYVVNTSYTVNQPHPATAPVAN